MIKIKKGIDIHLVGEAKKEVKNYDPQLFAIKPHDFIGERRCPDHEGLHGVRLLRARQGGEGRLRVHGIRRQHQPERGRAPENQQPV